ncbi:hypothetical protein ABEP17_06910 [Priestia flexa]|uniref:hypothetical protein n=1 Tax=Priestia flexa TaxID=86664 RepID=UPI003D2A7E49
MKRIKQLQVLMETEPSVVEVRMSRIQTEELLEEIALLQRKLNGIRFHIESPVLEDELHGEIKNILDDPNYDGI